MVAITISQLSRFKNNLKNRSNPLLMRVSARALCKTVKINIMSKITRKIAEIISKEMANSAYDSKIAPLESRLLDMVSDEVVKSIPIEVLEISKKYPKYFITRSEVNLSDGLNRLNYIKCRRLPSEQAVITVPSKVFAQIKELHEELKALHKVKVDLINKIESTLLKLGTHKRVQSEFPEAYKYLEMARASVPVESPSVMEIKNILALAKNS